MENEIKKEVNIELGYLKTKENIYMIKFPISVVAKMERSLGKGFLSLLNKKENDFEMGIVVILLAFGLEKGMKREYSIDELDDIVDECVAEMGFELVFKTIVETIFRDLNISKAQNKEKEFLSKKNK